LLCHRTDNLPAGMDIVILMLLQVACGGASDYYGSEHGVTLDDDENGASR
jgi:hypothetical protein